MAMALGLRPLPGPRAKPGLRPRQKANGHKLGAMAQDIRYPGVRVGEACGPQTASQGGVEGRKTITITIPYGIKPLTHTWPGSWGHGPGAMALAQAMAQDIRYPWVRVGEACGPRVAS